MKLHIFVKFSMAASVHETHFPIINLIFINVLSLLFFFCFSLLPTEEPVNGLLDTFFLQASNKWHFCSMIFQWLT